ncbi:MAG: glycosyltransferase [Ignavibacteriaceae bacterium]
MPVYNSAKYLKKSIDSILNQTFTNFEFLIIDDGSLDDSRKIINEYKDSRIRLISNAHMGIAKTLNIGLKEANYEWIARMDSDDIATVNRLSSQVEYLKHKNENHIVSSWYFIFKNSRILGLIKTPVNNKDIKKALLLHNVICHPGVMYNRKLIMQLGEYSDIPMEDYDLWFKVKNQVTFYNIPIPLILMRLNPSSLTRKNIHETNVSIKKIQNHYRQFLNEEFSINNTEKILILGWREFFYGDKKKARRIWSKVIFSKSNSIKLSIAFLITYLPQQIFTIFIEKKLRSRFELFIHCSVSFRKKIKLLISN